MDIFTEFFIKPFLYWKKEKSIKNSSFFTKSSLPQFFANEKLEIVEKIKNYLGEYKYIPDPLLFDHYTHPQVAVNRHNRYLELVSDVSKKMGRELTDHERNELHKSAWAGVSYDCDCLAVMAYALLKEHGYSPSKLHIYNLITDPIDFKNIWFNHVICVFEYDENWTGVFDTNGLNWFENKNGDWKKQIKDFFAKLYNAKYKYFIESDYPF